MHAQILMYFIFITSQFWLLHNIDKCTQSIFMLTKQQHTYIYNNYARHLLRKTFTRLIVPLIIILSITCIISCLTPHSSLTITAKDGSEFVARSCAPSTGPINSCDIIAKAIQFADQQNLDKLDCYTCDGDKCNTGNKRFATVSVVGLMLACVAFVL